jgi:cell wall-associated NlpC family hydrolase
VAVVRRQARGHRLSRLAIPLALCAVLQLAIAGPAGAVPPPPPNPSDSTISGAQAQANAKADQVGRLTNQLAQAQSTLQDLQDQVELKEEDANKALVDLQTAQDAAAQAQADAGAAQDAANAAGAAIDTLRKQVDQFTEGSFEQGSTLGSISAYIGSKSPADLLERQDLLSSISNSALDSLNQMQQARTAKANADSTARAALLAAQAKQTAATTAKSNADAAMAAASAAQQSQAARTSQLQATQTGLEQQLVSAQATVGDLKSQRAQYDSWLAAKQAQDARDAAAATAAAASAKRGGGGRARVTAAVGGSVGAVIARAMSELGMPYAWGGGTAGGPSRGIHDGGVADEYHDYDKIGFDCSGLMVYAFAAAGVHLPHYSGYQYTAGRHVPVSQMAPGDMLFYADSGGIHHVTLYIGGGQMIESPESGEVVHVTSVRYGGIMPYATRLL